MNENDAVPSAIQFASSGGVAAPHVLIPEHEIIVAPTTSEHFNDITVTLTPIACWRVDDLRFEFDSSFVRPEIADEVDALFDLRERNCHEIRPGGSPAEPPLKIYPPLSIFGHADPTGDDEYNKQLSGRRAMSVYALLVRDAALWEELSTRPAAGGGDNWGARVNRIMLDALGYKPGSWEAADQTGEPTDDAIRRFQRDRKMKVDGRIGPETRKSLFLAYMDLICGGPERRLGKDEDFLARGEDKGGKGDYQGCGEFNPTMIFSQVEHEKFSKPQNKADRDAENAANRRVMALLFRPGSRAASERWPCPRAKEGVAGCRRRFWSDAERRRNFRLADARRHYQETQDTFACRFYDRLVGDSPCEKPLTGFQIRLYDVHGRFISNAPCRVTIGQRKPYQDRADEQGIIVLRDVQTPSPCLVEWGEEESEKQAPELVYSLNMMLVADEPSVEQEARKKLNNLGYGAQDMAVNVAAFQSEYGDLGVPPLRPTGQLDKPTKDLLWKIYDDCADSLKGRR